jgi:hypothetical protein
VTSLFFPTLSSNCFSTYLHKTGRVPLFYSRPSKSSVRLDYVMTLLNFRDYIMINKGGITPRSTALLEKLLVAQHAKKFPALLCSPKFQYRVFTRALQWTVLSQMNPVQSLLTKSRTGRPGFGPDRDNELSLSHRIYSPSGGPPSLLSDRSLCPGKVYEDEADNMGSCKHSEYTWLPAGHSPLSSADVKNAWSYTSTPPHNFIAHDNLLAPPSISMSP